MLITTLLQVKFSVCQSSNCRNITLTETTGEYHATTNPTGWKTPESATNPDSTNVTRTVITITDPNAVVYTFDSDEVAPGFIPFPDPTGEVEMVILETSLGVSAGEKLPDGKWIFTFTHYGTINSGADTYEETATKTIFLTCQIRCCADTLFHEAAQSDCTDCKNEKKDKALEIDAAIKQIEYAASCGKPNMAAKFLTNAQWICNTSNCTNC